MASFTDKIRLVFDVDTVGGVGSIRKLKTEVQSADGVMGKLKAGAGGLGGMLKDNMGAAAMAAGAALVAFGKQSVDAFNDAALAAGKFSDTTAISVEDASKWIAVADDFGISADSIQGSMVRMSKAIGTNADALKGYGVEVARADDGTVDANQTFINAVTTIGKIKDPTERAAAAQKTFGKSYSEVSRLMSMDAKDLKAALDSTSDSQIIDDSELDKARDYQRAMDDLGDIIVDLKMEFGEALVPAIVQAADALKTISDFADMATGGGGLGKLYEWADKIFNPLTRLKDIFAGLGFTGDELEGKISDTAFALKDVGDGAEDAGDGVDSMDRVVSDFNTGTGRDFKKLLEDQADALADADQKLQILKGHLDDKQAWLNAKSAVEDLMTAIDENTSSWDDLAGASIDATSAVADYVAGLDDVPPEVKSSIYVALDQGNLDGVYAFIQSLRDGFDLPIYPKVVGGVSINGSVAGKRAAGGPVSAGLPYLVGENGPEIVVPSGSGNVIPNNRISAGGSGGSLVINNYSADPRAVIDIIKRWQAKGGRV